MADFRKALKNGYDAEELYFFSENSRLIELNKLKEKKKEEHTEEGKSPPATSNVVEVNFQSHKKRAA